MQLPGDEFQAIYKSAQDRFGPAEPGWTVWSINVCDLPGRGYPETTCNPHNKTITVRITESTKQYPLQQTYQLAHEAIHCLTPRNKRETLWFEEGFANWHAVTLCTGYRADAIRSLNPLFAEPYQAFCVLTQWIR